jgi:hypothetical protein
VISESSPIIPSQHAKTESMIRPAAAIPAFHRFQLRTSDQAAHFKVSLTLWNGSYNFFVSE